MDRLRQNQNPRQQNQATVHLPTRMNGKVPEEVDQFKYLKSTQTKDGTSIKEVMIRLAQAHSVMEKQSSHFLYKG